ncbi:hypothetical protein [Bacillus sp. T3]|uniref:hypothetical protein n=1 Tax=Bacillus sp. T3 TaxID=467262 RepID=UPI0039960BD9
MFSAKSVVKSGAGLVTLAVPETIYPMTAAQTPEALFLPLPGRGRAFCSGRY